MTKSAETGAFIRILLLHVRAVWCPVTWGEPRVRRRGAGARTWLPLRTVARRLGRNSNLKERVVESQRRRKPVGNGFAKEAIGTHADWIVRTRLFAFAAGGSTLFGNTMEEQAGRTTGERMKLVGGIPHAIFSLLFLLAVNAPQSLGQNKPEEAKPQAPAIKVRTGLVLIPAVVTDAKGNRITDMKKEDFVVLEDGKRQPIQLFERVETKAEVARPAAVADGV